MNSSAIEAFAKPGTLRMATAAAFGASADAFLETQGGPWDTPCAMTFRLIGASVSLLVLTRLHDRFE
jgi:putative membrane protein